MTDFLIRALWEGEVIDSENAYTEVEADAAYTSMCNGIQDVQARSADDAGEVTVQYINADTDAIVAETVYLAGVA